MIEKLKPIIQKVSEFQLERYRESDLQFDTKSNPTDFVSEVDIISEKMIVEEIEKIFPEAGILGEEGVQKRVFESDLLFVIDPLDGTGNYRSRLDCWAISIGLLNEGRIYEGLTAFPKSNEICRSNDIVNKIEFTINSVDDLYLFGTDRIFECQTK